MPKPIFILILFSLPIVLFGQSDSISTRLKFEADFRFRVEQDWNSRKADGSFRDDRTRWRYRLRAGANYTGDWYKVGFRLRTGNPIKQQDPQLTLGTGAEEFGTLAIGLEKAYFEGRWSDFSFWIGKNTFPFVKSNELFWSDNVFPEGAVLHKRFTLTSGILDQINLSVGHFIMSASGRSPCDDSFFQGYQVYASLADKRVELFPSLYLFRYIPNIPDGGHSFHLNYSIVDLGSRVHFIPGKLFLEFDYYLNLEEYDQKNEIPSNFSDQRSGFVSGLQYGQLSDKGDWLLKATYAHLQQYSIVDFMAQNDWARWDYSSFDSPDGRLSNYQGVELVAGYKVDKKINLVTKYYLVEQLISYDLAKETGSRIRFDIDVKF